VIGILLFFVVKQGTFFGALNPSSTMKTGFTGTVTTGSALYGNYFYAQSFVASSDYELSKVVYKLGKSGSPGASFAVCIKDITSKEVLPDGVKYNFTQPCLTSKTGINGNVFNSSVPTQIELTPIHIENGREYAIIISGEAATTNNRATLYTSSTSDSYIAGKFYKSSDKGASWQAMVADAYFEVWGYDVVQGGAVIFRTSDLSYPTTYHQAYVSVNTGCTDAPLDIYYFESVGNYEGTCSEVFGTPIINSLPGTFPSCQTLNLYKYGQGYTIACDNNGRCLYQNYSPKGETESSSSLASDKEVPCSCPTNYVCGTWTPCTLGMKTRTCEDTNNCRQDYIEAITCGGCVTNDRLIIYIDEWVQDMIDNNQLLSYISDWINC
jgi:hypothetical protein